MDKRRISERLERARIELERLQTAYDRALQSSSWESRDGDSTRKVENQSLAVLSEQIDKKNAEISALESMLANGKSGKAMRIGIMW